MGIEEFLLYQAYKKGFIKGFKIGYEEAIIKNLLNKKECNTDYQHIDNVILLSDTEIEKLALSEFLQELQPSTDTSPAKI